MKLSEIIIENFRGIGEAVKIKIDDIIVLIGNNNVGKTTILSAYEAYATTSHKLNKKDFFNEDETNIPIITGIFENVTPSEMSEKWIHNDLDSGYTNCIKVQYRWMSFNGPKEKYSFNPEIKEYEKDGTGGFESILTSRIPTPLKISPLDNPIEQEQKILAILTEAIKTNISKDDSKIKDLLNQIEELGQSFKEEIQEDVAEATKRIADDLSRIFPDLNHIELDVKSGKIEPEKLISAGSFIRIGKKPSEEGTTAYNVPLSHHGTGLQRTFLWSALKMLADTGRHKIGRNVLGLDRPKILLIEEPEAFLHPSAIREAREALYAIAELDNWQVMTTTHSPMFIDLTKNHTTIIRIEKDNDTNRTVKTFSTEEANFTTDDKENLKMMNYCNPYINEFFFAKHNLLVEGETEYSVVKSLIQNKKIDPNFHVLNCIGKGNIVTISKILNHFFVPYSILHDSDNPTVMKSGNKVRNGAWTNNLKIIEEVNKGREKELEIKTFVSIPNFEGEFLEEHKGKSKPYQAWTYFQETNSNTERFVNLITSIMNVSPEITSPNAYLEMSEIIDRTKLHISDEGLHDNDLWDLEFYYSKPL